MPGPGSYEPKKEMYSHISGIVGKDLRDSLIMSKTPGPGNYEQHGEMLKQKAPSWSVSKSSRDQQILYGNCKGCMESERFLWNLYDLFESAEFNLNH